MLGAKPTNSEKTIDFMRRLQHEDGSFDSVYVAHFVVTVLHELGAKPQMSFERFLLSLRRPHGGFGGLEADIESPSELEQTLLSLKLLRLVGHRLSFEKTKGLVLSLQNGDGSFGRSGYSRLGATFHGLASLDLLGFDVRTLRRTVDWVKSCEIPSGGFRATPDSYDPYIVIDDLYYGVMCLDIVGEECRYSSQTLDVIARFQNPNGGFRRSVFLGISTFESTYHALAAASAILADSHRVFEFCSA
jgi:hypothetical protein